MNELHAPEKTDNLKNLGAEIDAMYKIHDVLKDMPLDRSEKILKAVKILLEP